VSSSRPDDGTPARPEGAPRAGAVPRIEHIRFTAADLTTPRQRLMRTRLRWAGIGFAALFGLVALKLADATVVDPMKPKPVAAMPRPQLAPPPRPGAALVAAATADLGRRAARATITDRNGEVLAVSLPTASVFANPAKLIDPQDAATRLRTVLPDLDPALLLRRLSESDKQFVYIARQISPRDELAINALGIPGIEFEPTDRRRYPLGRVAAQVLGGVDVDGHGVAGVEKFFDERLRTDPTPLRLSVDVRVQAVVRDELLKAMTEFQAIGACGIVFDVNTGEVLAMVSLPDYDANDFGSAAPDERRNRATFDNYEPGSTFKLQDAAMALDSGLVHIWNGFDAAHPIRIGRFTITDFEGKHRWLYLPEILAYSSNLGAARMAAAIGPERQRAWMRRMGMLDPLGIELPEVRTPQAPPPSNWKEIATMTIGFGHGIAVSPLHVVVGTATIANGGIYRRPTILAQPPGAPPREGIRLMQQSTSDTLRKLMRLVVTDGYGKAAEVPGYYVGGKTGTAEKVGGKVYEKHVNVSAFMSAFPMQAPRYAVYMMLDSPHANASTHGYATAGWVAAPAAGRVIARIGPMLGLLPDTEDAARINAELYIPLQPGRPPGVPAQPGAPGGPPLQEAPVAQKEKPRTTVQRARPERPAAAQPPRDAGAPQSVAQR
jgi:cell division protein FtsI (penicillin-binding protein 3)